MPVLVSLEYILQPRKGLIPSTHCKKKRGLKPGKIVKEQPQFGKMTTMKDCARSKTNALKFRFWGLWTNYSIK